jgi:magnesium-transporting ATPase (P-type)
MVVTKVLAVGSYNLSRHNRLTKELGPAESLGNASVTTMDKTGTLTD